MPQGNTKYLENKELLKNPKVQAMLKVISTAEGATYNTRVGGAKFDDLSKKPGKAVYIPSIKQNSTAEGAYQFLNKTWEGVSKDLGLKDFSPESQDIAAVELIKRRGALNDILNDNFDVAINKLSPEWASLPTASGKGYYAGQKAKKIDKLRNIYFGSRDQPTSTQEVQTEQPKTSEYEEFTPYLATNTGAQQTAGEYKEPKEVSQAKQELIQAQNEENFIRDIQATLQPQQIIPEQPNYLQNQELFTLAPVEEIQYIQQPEFIQYAQSGGAIKNFYQSYINSPKYKERLITQGYENVGKVIEDRSRRVKTTKINSIPYSGKFTSSNTGSFYNPEKNIVDYDEFDLILYPRTTKEDIVAHEFSHAAGALKNIKNNNLTLSKKEIFEINKRNKSNDTHEKNAWEAKADMDVLRYHLKKDKIYDTGQKNITPELLKVAKQKYKNNETIKRFFDRFSDKDALYLMNNIAMNDTPQYENNIVAQEGGEIPISSLGVYAYPQQEVIVPTTDGKITMKNVNYPILGTDEYGNQQMMFPNQEYQFKGKTIHEIPQIKKKRFSK